VDAAGPRVDESGQRIDVGRLELLHGAVVEDLPRQLVDERELFEDVLGGRGGAGLGRLLPALEAEAIEEDVAQLDRRVDVELALGQHVDLPGQGVELPLHVAAHRGEERDVDPDPRDLEVGQDLHERHLHGGVDGVELLLREPAHHELGHAEDHVGVLARRLGSGFD
jgi:hypothetical protein